MMASVSLSIRRITSAPHKFPHCAFTKASCVAWVPGKSSSHVIVLQLCIYKEDAIALVIELSRLYMREVFPVWYNSCKFYTCQGLSREFCSSLSRDSHFGCTCLVGEEARLFKKNPNCYFRLISASVRLVSAFITFALCQPQVCSCLTL